MFRNIKMFSCLTLIFCLVFSTVITVTAEGSLNDIARGRKVTAVSSNANLQFNYGGNGGWAYSGNEKDASCLTNGTYYTSNGLYSSVIPAFKIDFGNSIVVNDIEVKNIPIINQYYASKPASLLGTEFWVTNDPTATWDSVRKEKGIKIATITKNDGGPQSWWKATVDSGVEKLCDEGYRYMFFGRDLGDYDNDGKNDSFEIAGIKVLSEETNVFGDIKISKDGSVVSSLADTSEGVFVAAVDICNYAETDVSYRIIISAFDEDNNLIGINTNTITVPANTKFGEGTYEIGTYGPSGTARVWATVISNVAEARTCIDSTEISLN